MNLEEGHSMDIDSTEDDKGYITEPAGSTVPCTQNGATIWGTSGRARETDTRTRKSTDDSEHLRINIKVRITLLQRRIGCGISGPWDRSLLVQ